MSGLLASATALLRRAVDVREGEAAALLLSFGYFFCLLCGYYILRPLREEMGIQGGVRNLQWLFTGTFVVMLAAVPLFGAVVARLPRGRFIPLVYRFFILNILIFYLLLGPARAGDGQGVHAARAFFIWTSVFNLFVVSVFWSVMADVFRSAQGKRLFGFIAAGGSAGAMAGPALVTWLAVPLGPVNLLLISALLLEGAVQCARRLLRAAPPAQPPTPAGPAARQPEEAIGGSAFAGFALLARSPYLLAIAGYILCLTAAATFLYFTQAHLIADAFDDSGERTRLFAAIDLAVNLLTILLQAFVTGRFIDRFGVAAALALLPAIVAAGFAGLAAAPVLAMIVAVQAVRRAANYAIARPAREILYTVVSPEEKYKAKNLIDTVIYRGGDAVSGWLFAGLAGAGLGLYAIAALALPLMALWIALAIVLGRRQQRLAAAEAS